MESMPLPENRRTIPKHWIVLGLLVVVHAGLGVFLPSCVSVTAVNPTYFMWLGFVFSQPILFALWAAFAPQRFYHRFLWSLLLCILVFFADECGKMFFTDD